MIRMERETIARMQNGNRVDLGSPALVGIGARTLTIEGHRDLNPSQLDAADRIFRSQEKIIGLDSVAGAGKTTTLAVIREGVEREDIRSRASPRPAGQRSS